jgi:hypothetical protein
MGLYDMPSSYIKFLLDNLTGWDWNAQLVDVLTVAVFGSALVISVLLNVRDWKKR